MSEEQPWLRLETESSPAYEAFRAYQRLGTCEKVAKDLGKSLTLITGWSSKHSWVARQRAFDQHLAAAETDGLVHDLSVFRDANLRLADKLRGHLSDRLDHFIKVKDDPTMRWVQAVAALAKLEANALLMNRDDKKTDERVEKLETLLARLTEDVDA
jgi:hypothetical protein